MARTAADFKSLHAPDQEVLYLRDQLAEAHRKLEAQKRLTGEARSKVQAFAQALDAFPHVPQPKAPPRRDSSKPSAIYCVHLTDLHNGEVTRTDEVEGFGEFNPELFDQRLDLLAAKVLEHVEVQRAGYSIEELRIIGTGDYISGDIHDELRTTNAYPAPVQAVRAGNKLADFVAQLAPHFNAVRTDWLTSDNHGRLTRKNQAADGGLNNWGFAVANIIQARLEDWANVEVHIHPNPSMLLQVGAERYLCFHGHQIKGWAGIPYYSFDRRLAMEAAKRMNVPEAAFTKLLLGHFHVAMDSLFWQVGGSLSGTNAFDHSCGRHARPHQTSWMVSPTHGQFGFTRWWLDDGAMS